MTEKKSDILKNIMINLGVVFILVGSTSAKGDMTFFFIGLVLLALQTFEFPGVQARKLVLAEIMLSATVAIGAVTQLVQSSGNRSQQAFIILLLLGGLLITVEAVRKYADL
jgi:spore maturation protein SpmB